MVTTPGPDGEDTDALRGLAGERGTPVQPMAGAAAAEHADERRARLAAAMARVKHEDAELLDRLAR